MAHPTRAVAIARMALGGALLLAAAAPARYAEACGGFFGKGGLSAERRPSLAYEQVLLIHDAKANKEHFIREVAFRQATETFGFVVPTPSRPTVAKVDRSPFPALQTRFPFTPPESMGGPGFGSGHGRLGGGRGVTVLEVSKVGSFTAFVLAADDEKALAKWLAANKLVSSAETDEWLAHYVRLKFYYVAMRYDPPPAKPGQPTTASDANAPLQAETVRISFATPVPYYPYLEPKTSLGLEAHDRALDLWVVGSAPVTPIALREQGSLRAWVRPMRPGPSFEGARERLSDVLPSQLKALLPAGELVVQTFQDQKLSRRGMGDVLFAPLTKTELSPEDREKMKPLLGLLDPELLPQAKP